MYNEVTAEHLSGQVVQAQTIGQVTVFAGLNLRWARRLKRHPKRVLLALGGAVIVGLGAWLVVPKSSDTAANGCRRKYEVVKDGTVRSQDNQTVIGDVRRGDEVRVDGLPRGAKNNRYEAIVLRTRLKGWVATASLDFETTVCDL